MTTEVGPDDRTVIPRWRSWHATERSGELGPLERTHWPVSADVVRSSLDQHALSFERDPGPHSASDLITSSLVLRAEDRRAVRAAESIIDDLAAPQAVRRLAKDLLCSPGAEKPDAAATVRDLISDDYGPRIARLRAILRREPRNSVRWVDLAWAYTASGLDGSAERAMRIALGLGSRNRFLLRAGARFELHRNDFSKAASLLRTDPHLLSDPWLLAAEIATATVQEKTSSHMRRARLMIEQGDFSAWHLSELASAVATVELSSGRTKSAKKLLRRALDSPTDNTLAQAEWSAKEGIDLIQQQQLDAPLGFEARARYAMRMGEWRQAAAEGMLWLSDQPFAYDAARITSFVSVAAEDYDQGVKAADKGLVTNPGSLVLLNDKVFSLANLGRVKEAATVVDSLDLEKMNDHDKAILTATKGLVKFRLGEIDAGRRLYAEANRLFLRKQDRHGSTLAEIFRAREELRARTDLADGVIRAALSEASRSEMMDVKLWAGRLQRDSRLPER